MKNNKIEKVFSVASTVAVILIVLCTIFLMGARVCGLKVYTIVSGSMEPAYHVGDLIYVKSVPASSIVVGDPITFVLNENLVVATHRVVKIDTEAQHFFTKGDNNQVSDISPVHFNNLIGKPIFRIPLLGYVSAWVQTTPGLYTSIAVGIALLGLVFIPDLFKQAREEEEKKKSEALAAANATPAAPLTAPEPEVAATAEPVEVSAAEAKPDAAASETENTKQD